MDVDWFTDPGGRVDDFERVKYLHHLEACARAVSDGVNLAGVTARHRASGDSHQEAA